MNAINPKDRTMPDTGTAIVEAKPDAKLPVRADDAPTSLLPAIIQASRDASVDVTKMEALMRMQTQLEEREAKREFAASFKRITENMPRVKKNGTIELGNKGKIAFARWEDMDTVLRPIITQNGCGLTFYTAPGSNGRTTITAELIHENGQSRSASIELPADAGPGRNALQAMGSMLSYGKRYCAEMLLNIVREGIDDDGTKGGQSFINNDQFAELTGLIEETGTDLDKFCAACGVAHLGEIQKGGFNIAKNLLLQKKGKKA